MLPINSTDDKNNNGTRRLSQGSTMSNIIIDIPTELLASENTLMVEKHSELFIGGRHLSQPAHPIRQAHGLCLVDTQQQDQRSVTATHQLQDSLDDNEVIQIKVEIPPVILQNGRTLSIRKSLTVNGSNQQQKPLGNFADLYNSQQHSTKSIEKDNIFIDIPTHLIARGQTIVIQKDNVSVTKTDDYHKQQVHHLVSNQFAKRDHLHSKNMMEVTFLISPELLNNGQTITIRQEGPQSVSEVHHHEHRHSIFEMNI